MINLFNTVDVELLVNASALLMTFPLVGILWQVYKIVTKKDNGECVLKAVSYGLWFIFATLIGSGLVWDCQSVCTAGIIGIGLMIMLASHWPATELLAWYYCNDESDEADEADEDETNEPDTISATKTDGDLDSAFNQE